MPSSSATVSLSALLRVARGEVADVERHQAEAGDLHRLAFAQEALGDAALVEDLERARVEAARACAGELLRGASLDDDDVDAGEAKLGGARERLPVHHRVGHGLSAVVADAGFDRRRQHGADPQGDAGDGRRDGRGHGFEALARAAHRRFAHPLDERDGLGQRHAPRAGRVQVAADRPRALVVVRVRRQPGRERDGAAIEHAPSLADRDEHCGVRVLGDAHDCAHARNPTLDYP